MAIAACLLLMVSCFLPWAYYSDIHQTFTGFYSYKNVYGKPGKVFLFIGVLSLVFHIVPKIWAKRANLFLGALGIGYAIKTAVLFTSCYNTICPEKKPGIYLMMLSITAMMVAATLPQMKLKQQPEEENS